jgi:membrane protease YdiL (CAAX protease family)
MQTTTISRIAQPTRRPLLAYVAATLAFTWTLHIPVALAEHGVLTLPLPSLALLALGGYGPTILAIAFTARADDWAGVRALVGRALRWRVAPLWYSVVLAGPLLLHLAAMGLHAALGGQPPQLADLIGQLPRVLLMSVAMLPLGPLGEEIGWRGYLLPALQARMGALAASLLLGAIWAAWHLPLFWMPSQFLSQIPFPLFLVSLAGLSTIYTWFSNSTQGNMLLPILLHAVLNVTTNLWQAVPDAPSPARMLTLLSVGGTCLSIVLVLSFGPRTLARQPRRVAAGAPIEDSPAL